MCRKYKYKIVYAILLRVLRGPFPVLFPVKRRHRKVNELCVIKRFPPRTAPSSSLSLHLSKLKEKALMTFRFDVTSWGRPPPVVHRTNTGLSTRSPTNCLSNSFFLEVFHFFSLYLSLSRRTGFSTDKNIGIISRLSFPSFRFNFNFCFCFFFPSIFCCVGRSAFTSSSTVFILSSSSTKFANCRKFGSMPR